MSNDMLLGSAIQLIKDIERISFLGDKMECVKINQMTKDWLKQFDAEEEGADNDSISSGKVLLRGLCHMYTQEKA